MDFAQPEDSTNQPGMPGTADLEAGASTPNAPDEMPAESAPLVLSAVTSASPVEFERLDSRVVGLWRLTHSILMGVLLLALAVGGVVVGLAAGGLWPVVLGVWLLLAGLAVWQCTWYPRRAYAAWGYRIDARVLETRSGILVRVTRLLPLPRLQHVDLQRGPFERAFGLASLILHTAGTREAVIVIPGLDADHAVQLRDHLVKIGGDDAV